jgi:hypothetical protein
VSIPIENNKIDRKLLINDIDNAHLDLNNELVDKTSMFIGKPTNNLSITSDFQKYLLDLKENYVHKSHFLQLQN